LIPGSFDYHRPTSLGEAVALLSGLDAEARLIAGGHSLIPMMKLRLASPSHLIDLAAIKELRGVSAAGGDAIVIGAMTTQHELIASELLAARLPIIRETAQLIADPQVRYCGTLGGNVANGDPGNDMPALMMCLGAVYVLQGKSGERRIRARDYYQGAYATAAGADEILTAVSIAPPAGHGYAYEKLKRKVGDYATAAAGVILTLANGTVATCSIGLTNVADTPLFAQAASDAVIGSKLDKAALARASAAAETIASPAADGRGSAEYRRKMAGVMTARALSRAFARANG